MIIMLLARCDCFRMARMYKFDKQETDVKNEEEEQKEEQGDENVGENPRENQEEELEAESEDMLKEILDTLKEQHQSFYGT